jgi:hypothetical protein
MTQISPSGRARTTIAKGVAAVGVVAALALGAGAITKSGSSAASTAGAPGGQMANGQAPRMGTAVTGATLTKLKQVVTAKYPGTVERAMKLSDGTYAVDVKRSSGEVHVRVGQDFAITGTMTGGPPGGGQPPAAR